MSTEEIPPRWRIVVVLLSLLTAFACLAVAIVWQLHQDQPCWLCWLWWLYGLALLVGIKYATRNWPESD